MVLLVRGIDLSSFSSFHDCLDDVAQVGRGFIPDNLRQALLVGIDKLTNPIDLWAEDVPRERKTIADFVARDDLCTKPIAGDPLAVVVVLKDGDQVLDRLNIFVFVEVLGVESLTTTAILVILRKVHSDTQLDFAASVDVV